MNRIKEWRQRPGLSQAALADLIGVGQSDIAKLENGVLALKVDRLAKLARALDVDPRELADIEPMASIRRNNVLSLNEDATPFKPAGDVDLGPADLPIYGIARGGSGDFLLPTEAPPVDWTFRPPLLKGVRDAFAVFVRGDSMRPMFRPGQALWIHPHLPLVQDEGVLIVRQDDLALIKEFIRSTADEIVVREYQPAPREFSIPHAEIRHAYRIIGAFSMR